MFPCRIPVGAESALLEEYQSSSAEKGPGFVRGQATDVVGLTSGNLTEIRGNSIRFKFGHGFEWRAQDGTAAKADPAFLLRSGIYGVVLESIGESGAVDHLHSGLACAPEPPQHTGPADKVRLEEQKAHNRCEVIVFRRRRAESTDTGAGSAPGFLTDKELRHDFGGENVQGPNGPQDGGAGANGAARQNDYHAEVQGMSTGEEGWALKHDGTGSDGGSKVQVRVHFIRRLGDFNYLAVGPWLRESIGFNMDALGSFDGPSGWQRVPLRVGDCLVEQQQEGGSSARVRIPSAERLPVTGPDGRTPDWGDHGHIHATQNVSMAGRGDVQQAQDNSAGAAGHDWRGPHEYYEKHGIGVSELQ